jgi:hypothetical protein
MNHQQYAYVLHQRTPKKHESRLDQTTRVMLRETRIGKEDGMRRRKTGRGCTGLCSQLPSTIEG